MMPGRDMKWPVIVSWVCGAAALATVLGPPLAGGRLFAVRDAFHFYAPLFQVVRGQWLAGRIPLWNPLVNGGQPLAASPTSGVLYPPEIAAVLLLPADRALTAYVCGHVIFAGWAAWWLARSCGRSAPAAIVAGLAYALSGAVVHQIYNPVFLCGAGWLALALAHGRRLVNGAGLRSGIWLGVALAMCVLCGDPQAAYHAGLALGLQLLTDGVRPPTAVITPMRLRLSHMGWQAIRLLGAAALACLLALPQVVLTARFAGQSERAAASVPRSLWETGGLLFRSSPEGLRSPWYAWIIGAPPAADGHYREMYAFSFEPWRTLEVFWPNIWGLDAPSLGRWGTSLGIETGNDWITSLYFGAVPLVGVIVAAAFRQRECPDGRWWRWLCGLALLASFGGYGVGFLLRLGGAALGLRDAPGLREPGNEIGGLYWMLVTCLPGYAGFRFPAKWLVVFALAAGQLAAVGVDQLRSRRSRRLAVRTAGTLAAVGALALGLVVVARLCHDAGWASLRLGTASPAQLGLVIRAVQGHLVHGAVAAGSTAAALLFLPRRLQWMLAALVAITAVDLSLAASRLIVTVEPQTLAAAEDLVATMRAGRLPECAATGSQMRIFRSPEVISREADWMTQAAAEARSLGEHVPWVHGVATMGYPDTITFDDVQARFGAVGVDGNGRLAFDRDFMGLWATEFLLLPPESSIERTHGPEFAFRVARNERALPRARFVSQWLEGPQGICELPAAGSGLVDACRVVVDNPDRVVIEAATTEAGMIVLADTLDAGWHAALSTDGGPARSVQISPINGRQRGCLVPPGNHVLTQTYSPPGLAQFLAIMAVGWAAAAGLLVWAPRETNPETETIKP